MVGMGGVGKVTPAQLVYNDNRVENHFAVKAWLACQEVKIAVTTGNQSVSLMVKTGVEYLLQKLSNYHFLYIFAHHSLGTNDIGVHDQELKEIGEKIVKRCDGLPLVAKVLGGLWGGKYDINDWRDALNSKIWNLSKEECEVMSALKV
ncbi:putative disease resistance protein RGA3, partial [Pistacia vera]|uniref:putative disease resistance protein RGA3 n=1 Tax=Pistacia vera TaxID=55513 RepID=UPI00126317B8